MAFDADHLQGVVGRVLSEKRNQSILKIGAASAVAIGALFIGAFLEQQALPPADLLSQLEQKVAGHDLTPQKQYNNKIKVWREMPIQPTVMLGDSLTEYVDWESMLGHGGISNRGIARDTTEGVLKRLDVSSPVNGTVFLMIGTNDLSEGTPVDQVAERYARILDGLSRRGNRIYAQSVIYTGYAKLNPKITAFNASIEKLCAARPNCRYVDVNKTISPSGLLPRDVRIDNVHLNYKGYHLWAEALKGLG